MLQAFIKYFGHEANRFGYKFWALCGSLIYCSNFDLYCDENLLDQRKDLQLESKVVLSMLDAVEELQSHTVFFENFFTSCSLLIYLRVLIFKQQELYSETVKKIPFDRQKTMNKQRRGTHGYSFDTNEKILIVRWLVNIGTKYDTAELIYKVTR